MATTTMRTSVWVSVVITVAMLAVYLVVSFFIPQPENGLPLVSLGVFLAVVPALVWLVFFYQRDNVEPEPKHLVARVFLFGALAAAAVSIPLTELFFNKAIAPLNTVAARFIVTVLSVSIVEEVLKVAMVRYVVLGTDEFDEHPDGIVYGLAAGLGFATVVNIDFVLRSGGVLPLQAAIHATESALIQGALGAFTGYFLGRVKLDGERAGWLAGGLAVAIGVNGLYHTVSDEVSSLGLSFQPLNALLVAVILAVGLGVVLFSLFGRAHQLAAGQLTTITQQARARALDMPWDIAPRYDGVLIGLLVLALLVGGGVGVALDLQKVLYSDPELPVTLAYPSNWAVQSSGGGLLVIDLEAGTDFPPTFQLSTNRLPPGATLESLRDERIARQAQQLDFYRTITREAGPLVGGQSTQRVTYEYVTLTNVGPVVARGEDTLLIYQERLYILRYVVEADQFTARLGEYERILSTVRFR